MSGRVRLWVFGTLGFVEGQAIEASPHGLKMRISPALPTALLQNGRRHPLELVNASAGTVNVMAEIRHVTDLGVGLSIEDRIPLERFRDERSPTTA